MGAASEEDPTRAPSLSGHAEKIFVSVRLRPLNEKEIARNDVSDWECINDNTIIYRNTLSIAERSMYPTSYTFDRVFRCDCNTRKVYEEGAKEVALSVISGINSSVFAYGQTSSGKTYTMSGITEYTMADIYDYIEKHKERTFVLKFSALEIYNESVGDLLSADTTPLRLLDDPERGTIVERLTEETLKDRNHLKELLSICETQRQIGETSLNETSSRSHQILRLTIESSAREFFGSDPNALTATVNFIDLAGSERASQALSAGTRLKEGCHINRSLLTLGTVIRKLSKGRNGHVPFRDSKLTRILQSSLGGNARTAIICTMSPARSHVEQSRNTLLFASCAKEVTTNAQVNIVMSDKALVKHLQRELARLENELRSSVPPFVRPDSAAMLREKDLRIQKLEKEVAKLTLQRDLARAQAEDLEAAGKESDDKPPLVYAYPKLRVRSSWDFENAKIQSRNLANPPWVDLSIRSSDTSSCSHGHSRGSSDENFYQLPDFGEKIQRTKSYQQNKFSVPNFIETDLHQEEIEEPNDENIEYHSVPNFVESDLHHEEIEEPNDENIEYLYNDVHCMEESTTTDANANTSDIQCIQMEKSTNADADADANKSDFILNIEGDLNMPSTYINPAPSGLTETDNKEGKSAEVKSRTLKEQKEWKNNIIDSVIATAREQPSWFVEKDTCTPSNLKLARSKSCKASLIYTLSSYQFENDEKNESIPPIIFEKDFTGRPGILPRKFSPLKFVVDTENSSINRSQISERSSAFDELKELNVEAPDAAASTCISISIAQTEEMIDSNQSTPLAQREEMSDPQDEKQLADDEDTQEKSIKPVKSVRDVGVDPIQDGFVSQWEWPLEFKRLQEEIIELWHACNISLIHRTYFLLLFKGDPEDSIYMEVEHRRLSFLKDMFSQGNQAMEDGRTVTQASSMKALQRERHMLSQQMKKKFSREQRHNLFLKWGIGLQTKHRRWQLTNLFWTETKDMNHIAESAAVVEKLVTFTEPEPAFREMFGLNFSLRRPSKKRHLWQWSVKLSYKQAPPA